MKVGIVTPTTAGKGGIEAVVRSHVDGLRRRGHEVVLLTGPELGSGPVARALACAGLALRRVEALRGCDVVLAHYPPAHVLARRAGRPYVHFFHHPLRIAHPHEVSQGQGSRLWQRLGTVVAGLDRKAVVAAAVVAAPTSAMAREARTLHGVEAEVLPLGVDQATPVRARREGLLFVGRPDEPCKHLDWAEDVAQRLDCRLDVVGHVPRGRTDGPHVRFLGYRTGRALQDSYAQARVLVFPSVGEGFGLVPLEALAAGLPVVAWDDGHGPSTTLAEGSGGVLVPPYDLDAMTAAVRRLLTDTPWYDGLSAAGPAWVHAHFSTERHLDGLEDLLTRAVGA